jgi:hypothetical protein
MCPSSAAHNTREPIARARWVPQFSLKAGRMHGCVPRRTQPVDKLEKFYKAIDGESKVDVLEAIKSA